MLKKLTNPLAIIFITLLLDKLGENIIFPLLPYILSAYNPDGMTLGLLASTSQGVAVLSGPLVGSLSDSIGRRPVIVSCIALNFISLLIFGWAGSLTIIFTSRALGGLGSSTIGTLQAYITDISSPETRSRNLGISGAAFGLGAIAGPALGGGLVGFGASVPVFAAAFLTGINLLIGFIFLRETVSEENKKTFDISSINIFKSISRILSRPNLRAVSVSFALFNFSFTAFTSLLVLALKDLYGWSAGQTSGIFIVVGVVVTYTQVAVVGKLVNRWSEGFVNKSGYLFVSAGILLLPLAGISSLLTATLVVGSSIALAIGASLVLPTARSLVSGLVSSNEQGVQLASLASLSGIASCLGPIIAGWLYDIKPIASFSVEALACLTGWLLLNQQQKQKKSLP